MRDATSPAFPVNGPNGDHPGMSLRDYFAAAAMQGLLARLDSELNPTYSARAAYHYADAMLAARSQATSTEAR